MENGHGANSGLPPRISQVTLGQLQRIYRQSYTRLREALPTSLSDAEAHHVVQEAFAAAARTRFTFQTEQSLAAWIEEVVTAGSGADTPTQPVSSIDTLTRSACDWDDVLARAAISTHAQQDAAPIEATPSLGRIQVAATLRALLTRDTTAREAHTESGPELPKRP